MLTGLAFWDYCTWHLRGTPASSVLEYSGAPPPKRLPIPALNPPEPCELVSMAVKVSKCQTGSWKEVANLAEAANFSRFATLKNIRRAAGVTAPNKLCPDTMSFVFNLNVKKYKNTVRFGLEIQWARLIFLPLTSSTTLCRKATTRQICYVTRQPLPVSKFNFT